MFNLNEETGEIRIPQGDTALFRVVLNCKPLPEGCVAVFGVKQAASAAAIKSTLLKVFDVIDNRVLVRLTNQDTRDIKPGNYLWDLRIVTDPDRNEAGEIRAYDPGDNVYSIFSGNTDMPQFIVTNAAAEV